MARSRKPAPEPVAWVVYADDTDDLRRGRRFTSHLDAQRYARVHTWMGQPAEIDALYRFRVNYYDGADRDNYGSKIVTAMNEEAVREAFYESLDGDSWEISSVEKLRPDTGPRGPDPKISHGTGGLGSMTKYEQEREDAARFDREIRAWIYAGTTERVPTEDGGWQELPARGVTSSGPDSPDRWPAKVWVHDGGDAAEAEGVTRTEAFRQAVNNLSNRRAGVFGLGAAMRKFWGP